MLVIMKEAFILIFVFLIYSIDLTNSGCRGPILENLLNEIERNVGDICFANQTFNCSAELKYRTIDGTCTNLKYPHRGMSGSVFMRLLPALYGDNDKSIRTQKSGKPLVSPRVVSNTLFGEQREKCIDNVFTLSLMQWGQVITHDIMGTAKKLGPDCCQQMNEELDNCIAASIPPDDHFYSKFGVLCSSIRMTKTNEDINCNIHPVLPLNFVTAHLDSSLLYGSTVDTLNLIREKTCGRMLSQLINGSIYPPNVGDPKSLCRVENNEELCIQAGDGRANIHPILAVLQTILLRLHNKIATELSKINLHWDDETLFQESRRIVIAIEQHITFKYYLPNILGQKYVDSIQLTVKDTGYNNIYDESVNPQMTTEFSGCAFRAFHSTIVDRIIMYNEERCEVSSWHFSDFYNEIGFIAEGDNFENLVIGLATQQQANMDRFFPTSITDLLFQVNGLGGDLESLDIEQGRIQGLNLYAKYLEMIGMKYPKCWEDYVQIPPMMLNDLKSIYDSYDEVEPFVGGILEDDAEGAIIGPVFQAIIGEQFSRLQQGDRFYYELGDQAYPFTPEQLQEIRKVTLSFVYCYTNTKLKFIQPDAFRRVSETNQLIPCANIIENFSLFPWKESSTSS